MTQRSQKKPQTPETYNSLYESGGFTGIYHLDYRESPYLPLFRAVLRELHRCRVQSILDVGCGNGAFARFLAANSTVTYRGFDFSSAAISLAQKDALQPAIFSVGDAYQLESYAGEYDAVVCTEVLEHLTDELDIITKWKPGTQVVCSVPNFASPYHERYFGAVAEVEARYGLLVNIGRISFIRKPPVGNYAQLWGQSLIRARRLAGYLVRCALGKEKGWFLFSGVLRGSVP